MKRKIAGLLPVVGICILLVISSTCTAFAVPEDYITEIEDGVNSALDDAETYLDDIWNNVTDVIDETVNDVQDYITATEPESPTTEAPTDNIDDDYSGDEDNITPEPTEPPTEEVTALQEPTENEGYDFSYEPPTEPPTEAYVPEILTETYTDPPFIERFAITDAEEGNLFIALGLWISIAIGIIIVASVVNTTHKRKKGI